MLPGLELPPSPTLAVRPLFWHWKLYHSTLVWGLPAENRAETQLGGLCLCVTGALLFPGHPSVIITALHSS